MRRRSLRLRITVAATVAAVVGVAAAALALHVLLRRSLLSHVDDVAETQISDVAALLAQDTLPATLADSGEDGSVVHVVDAAGNTVAVTAGAPREPPAFVPRAGDVRSRTIDGRRVSALALPTTDGTWTIFVSTSLESVDEAMTRLRGALLVVGPLLVAFVGVTTWVVVDRALRPVEAIRERVADISSRSLAERVPVPPSDDEIGRLARTMNEMLDRVEGGVDRQRRFVADASHEALTPLASLRAGLEASVTHPDHTDWPATARDLLATTAALERLLRDLLYLARADEGIEVPRTLVDLDDVVIEEAAALRTRARVPIDTSRVSGAAVVGRREDLARVVRNLLDNADRHAASRVTLSLATANGTVTLVVADDGPGIPAADRERVFERFTRLDDARARATGGTGLGLAIARELVTAHGGRIDATDRGMVVELPSG